MDHRPAVATVAHHRGRLARARPGEPGGREAARSAEDAAGPDHEPAYTGGLEHYLLVRRAPGDEVDRIRRPRLVHRAVAGVAVHPHAAREDERLGLRAAAPRRDQRLDGDLVLGDTVGGVLERRVD